MALQKGSPYKAYKGLVRDNMLIHHYIYILHILCMYIYIYIEMCVYKASARSLLGNSLGSAHGCSTGASVSGFTDSLTEAGPALPSKCWGSRRPHSQDRREEFNYGAAIASLTLQYSSRHWLLQ